MSGNDNSAGSNQNDWYYCYNCMRHVNGISERFTCPTCDQGFLERVDEVAAGGGRGRVRRTWPQGGASFFERAIPGLGFPTAQATGAGQGDDRLVEFDRFLMELLDNLASNDTYEMQFTVERGNPVAAFTFDDDMLFGGLDAFVTQVLNQFEGGAPPLSNDDINRIPTEYVSLANTDESTQCSVCFEEYQEGAMVRRLSCNHRFHDPCIVPWLRLHNTCPVCRKAVFPRSRFRPFVLAPRNESIPEDRIELD